MAATPITPPGVQRAPRRWALAALSLASLLAVGAIAVAWRAGTWIAEETTATQATPPSVDLLTRGAYLATAGNCAGCHSNPGREPWAGGRAIDTPFGTVYSSNLTPDRQTGLGNWTSDDFWRALHHGRSRDRRFLLPVFPYAQYTQVTPDDADALFAYLQPLIPVAQASTPNAMR